MVFKSQKDSSESILKLVAIISSDYDDSSSIKGMIICDTTNVKTNNINNVSVKIEQKMSQINLNKTSVHM